MIKKIVVFWVLTVFFFSGCVNQGKTAGIDTQMEDCGSFNASERDACCTRNMKDRGHVDCEGFWKYNANRRDCEFVCRGDEGASLEDMARKYCEGERVAEVSLCGEYIKIVTNVEGTGATFLMQDKTKTHCPDGPPDSMTQECRILTQETECTAICRP